ncbi:MAG: family 16 glycosylhydrolase [Chloroflexi bacterium]|nr:family 16 glycosylhydrolase [Chloroflexota bacterium]
MSSIEFTETTTAGGEVEKLSDDSWRLSLPPGSSGEYRLAQLDDYAGLSRKQFPWQPPVKIRLRARASAHTIPGTWGFGLWNDPISFSLGLGGGIRRLPALPNTAWFFFASPHNHLSLRDDLPAQGALAATFNSPAIPALLLGFGAPILPLLAWPPAARLLRRVGRRLMHQDAASISASLTEWHTYALDWQPGKVTFKIDDEVIYSTNIAPRHPLGVVIWLDNQYAALPPNGRLAYGTLPNDQPTWIEIEALSLTIP